MIFRFAALMVCALLWQIKAYAVKFKVDLSAAAQGRSRIEIFAENENQLPVYSALSVEGQTLYTLPFANQGLYTIKIKANKKLIWQEIVYVLLAKPKDQFLLKASWAITPETQRSVIRVLARDGSIRYGVSIRDKIYLRLRSTPALIRIANEDIGGLRFPAAEVQVALISDADALQENQGRDTDIQLDPYAPNDDQTVYEPEWKGVLAGKEDSNWRQKIVALNQQQKLVPLNRKSRVDVWLRTLSESFELERGKQKYIGEKSQGLGTGFMANIGVKEIITLQLSVDTHGTSTEYEVTDGANPPAQVQKRGHITLGPLVDVLNVNHKHPDHGIDVGFAFGYDQIPLEKDNQGVFDLGFMMRYQLLKSHRLSAQARFFKSHSYDFDLLYVAPYSLFEVKPLVGFYLRHIEHFATDAMGSFEENGLRLGLSREF